MFVECLMPMVASLLMSAEREPLPHPRRPALVHPQAEDLRLWDVLRALGDPNRLTIVEALGDGGERACGTFPVSVAASTLSHHLRVLREAGVICQRDEGSHRWTALRRSDVEGRFPGLLDPVLRAARMVQGPAP